MANERAQVILELVKQALDPKLRDEDLGQLLERLDRMVPHPDIGNLMFHQVPELTAEQIVERALAYRPIALGHEEN